MECPFPTQIYVFALVTNEIHPIKVVTTLGCSTSSVMIMMIICGDNGIKDVVAFKWASAERNIKSLVISKLKWIMHNSDYDYVLAVLCLWGLFVILIWCSVHSFYSNIMFLFVSMNAKEQNKTTYLRCLWLMVLHVTYLKCTLYVMGVCDMYGIFLC